MYLLLCIGIVFFVFLQGCHGPSPSSVNEDAFKKYANTNSIADPNSTVSNATVNSSTSVAQPDTQQAVTLGNVSF